MCSAKCSRIHSSEFTPPETSLLSLPEAAVSIELCLNERCSRTFQATFLKERRMRFPGRRLVLMPEWSEALQAPVGAALEDKYRVYPR